MHIPDGYLGPTTCGFFYLLMLPVWTAASRVVKKTLKARQVPLLAIGAAFSFVIMMFNLPIPGGTSGHAVGAVLVAILVKTESVKNSLVTLRSVFAASSPCLDSRET